MNHTFYLGNNLEILPRLKSESVDLIITSPPYNLGNNHHTGSSNTNTYFDNLPESLYQMQQTYFLTECFRVLKKDGSMFYNHKNRIKSGLQITPYQWLLRTDFIIKQEIVWFNGSQNFDKIRFYPMTERVYWLAKSPKTKLMNNINHHDYFDKKEWPPVGTGGKFKRAFPEQLVNDLMLCFPDAKTVLDPYGGSGTVSKVARQLGKNSIYIDLEQEYVDMAIEVCGFNEGEVEIKK